MPDLALTQAFVARLPSAVMQTAGWEDALEKVVAHGKASWPDLDLSSTTFAGYVAERVPAGTDLVEALSSFHSADLFLACACAHDVSGAVRAFDSHLAPTVAAFIRQLGAAQPFADEIRQTLLQRLFVPGANNSKRISSYSGRGKLSSWVGVTVQRIGLTMKRRESAHPEDATEALGEAMPAGTNPELDYLKARYRAEFREAFQNAVAQLTERERLVLRYHFVKGLNQQRIAAMYGVNQSAVSRWIASAKESIRRSAEKELREKLRASTAELQSIAELIRSQFDMGLSSCLGTE